jgi:hypothetical protein
MGTVVIGCGVTLLAGWIVRQVRLGARTWNVVLLGRGPGRRE